MKRIRVVTPLPPLTGYEPLPSYETRMASQRAIFAYQDRQRYVHPWKRGPNPRQDSDGDKYWLVFAWSTKKLPIDGRAGRWVLVAERRVRSRRRKPMTMNRLFAGIRQQIGLRRDVIVRLITINDHASALAADPSWFTRAPRHFPSLRPDSIS